MNEYLFRLLISKLQKTPPPLPPEDVDWVAIFKKSVDQQLQNLTYAAIATLPEEVRPKGDLFEQWQKLTVLNSFRYATFFVGMDKLFAAVDNAGLGLTVLKGVVVKDLYPGVGLRTMGDMDLLADVGDFDKLSDLFVSLGYEREITHAGNEHAFKKQGQMNIELFKNLENDFRMVYDTTEPYRQNQLPYKSFKNVKTLSPEWQVIHWCVHFTKHFSQIGAGIRNIFDLYYMQKAYEPTYDGKFVRQTLKKYGMFEVFRAIEGIVELYFGQKSPDKFNEETAERTLRYMLGMGVYGATEAGYTKLSMRKGKFRGVMSHVFPPFKAMKTSYPYLEKAPILLPFAWVQRCFRAVFLKRDNVKVIIEAAKDESVNEANELMKELGVENYINEIKPVKEE